MTITNKQQDYDNLKKQSKIIAQNIKKQKEREKSMKLVKAKKGLIYLIDKKDTRSGEDLLNKYEIRQKLKV